MDRVLEWGPAALWAAVLFLLSDQEGLGRGLPPGVDKLVHGGLYLILGLSLAWGKRRTASSVSAAVLLLMGVGYAASDEWHQTFVPGRDASVGDWVADSVGIMLGLALFSILWSRSRNSGRPSSGGATTTASAGS